MFHLFKSEFKRYHKAAWLVFIAQMMVWAMIGKISPILAPASQKLMYFIITTGVGGFAFALLSMGLNTRKSHWAYLLHRPLAVHKIHLALTGASLLLLFIGLVLPFTVVLVFLDIFTDNVVDLRHYLYCVHLFGLAAVAYFCGCFAVLTPSKAAYLAIWPVTYLMMGAHRPAGIDLLIDAIFVAISFYAVRLAFKPNLSVKSLKKRAIVVSSLILQPAIVLVMVAAQALYFHLPLSVFSAHPRLDTSQDSLQNFAKLEDQQQYTRLLKHTNFKDKASLQRQVTLGKFKSVIKSTAAVPNPNDIKGQLFMKDRSFFIPDVHNKQNWLFSHDQMLFVGRDQQSGKVSGLLGVSGFTENPNFVKPEPFQAVPVMAGNQFISVKNQLFRIDFEQQKLILLHTLTVDEYYITPANMMFDTVVMASNQTVYLFDAIDFMATDIPLNAKHTIKHPIDAALSLNISMTEVKNGYLLRYTSPHYLGFNQPGASLGFIPHEGQAKYLAKTAFTERQLPAFIEFQLFVFSPIANNLLNGTLPSIVAGDNDKIKPYRYFWQRQYGMGVYLFCLFGAIFSAVVTWVLASRMLNSDKIMNKSNRLVWTLMNAVLALPGLVAFLLLNDWKNTTRGSK
ncbi:MAG: hypothetical protein HRT35_19505 [Algicola sp.]|nr:hypothetical protein [Algicola sp.]